MGIRIKKLKAKTEDEKVAMAFTALLAISKMLNSSFDIKYSKRVGWFSVYCDGQKYTGYGKEGFVKAVRQLAQFSLKYSELKKQELID